MSIDTDPSVALPQAFINLDKGNQVDLSPAAVNTANVFITSPIDLTTLGWETGDRIKYVTTDGDLQDL